MAATGEEGFARNFLCLIGNGDAPPHEQRPGQQREEIEEKVEVELGLSLGGLFAIDRKGDELRRSSSVMAVATPPVEVPATPAVPRASGSPSSASSEGDGQRLQDSVLTPPVEVPAPAPLALPRESSLAVQAEEHAARLPLPASGSPSSASLKRDGQRLLQGTVMRTSSVPAVIEDAGNIEKKMVEKRNSTSSTSKEAAGQAAEENKNHSSGKDPAKRRRGRPPKYQATTLASQGTTVTEESSSSSVPSSSKAARRVTAASRPLPPSSLAPRTAVATLGSSRDKAF